MILVNIDRDSPEPLYNQVSKQIQLMIEEEKLSPGDRLPSTRQLSEQLNLNRTTVSRAYENLWALGYIESQTGSYTRIRKREALNSESISNDSRSIIDWENKLQPACQKMIDKMNYVRIPSVNNNIIDLVSLSPSRELWPLDDFRKCINLAALNDAPGIYSYSDPAGHLPLRESLAGYLREHQIRTCAEELIITSGAQAAIDLVFRSLLNRGDCIIAENPTYGYIMPLAEYYNCTIIPINMKKNGMDLNALEEILKTVKPSLLYTMPNFQNPTGITTSQKHREKLLSLCEDHKIPILEDGFVEELKYTGKTILPIKSMDKNGIVIYIGTFSKVLFPGLRTGWIVAPKEYTKKLSVVKNCSELCGNNLAQEAFRILLDNGLFEKYVRKIHSRYKNRMNTAMKAARHHLDQDGVSFTKPDGGYTFWVSLDNSQWMESELLESFINEGVAVSPGSRYFSSGDSKLNFRISIAKSDSRDINKGIELIGRVLRSKKANQEIHNVNR